MLKHLTKDQIEQLGQLVSINVDRNEKHVVAAFDKSWVLVFALKFVDKELICEPLNSYGPFGSGQ